MCVVRKFLLSAAVASQIVLCRAADVTPAVTSAWSSVICVDTRLGPPRFAKPDASVSYAPRYSFGTSADHVVLRSVRNAGTAEAVTNEVGSYAAGAEGGVTISLAPGDERCYRLLHTAYDANDVAVGETLVADVAFAVTGTAADDALVDTRENSLQLVAEELAAKGGGTVSLPYSTDWLTNGVPASVRLTCVCDHLRRGVTVESTTNDLLSAAAPVTDVYPYLLQAEKRGRHTFMCSFLDAQGALLGEPLTASYYFKDKWGLWISIK